MPQLCISGIYRLLSLNIFCIPSFLKHCFALQLLRYLTCLPAALCMRAGSSLASSSKIQRTSELRQLCLFAASCGFEARNADPRMHVHGSVCCLPRLDAVHYCWGFCGLSAPAVSIFYVAVPKARLLWMIWTESSVIRDPDRLLPK